MSELDERRHRIYYPKFSSGFQCYIRPSFRLDTGKQAGTFLTIYLYVPFFSSVPVWLSSFLATTTPLLPKCTCRVTRLRLPLLCTNDTSRIVGVGLLRQLPTCKGIYLVVGGYVPRSDLLDNREHPAASSVLSFLVFVLLIFRSSFFNPIFFSFFFSNFSLHFRAKNERRNEGKKIEGEFRVERDPHSTRVICSRLVLTAIS